jgi:hypothetical protein
MKTLLRFAVLALGMGLGACFESAQPLIAANDADFPFDRGVRYTFYEWDKDRRTWQPSETGTVTREGDHYVQLEDGAANNDATPFVLKSIGNGYFIAQQPDHSVYIYDLVRIQGDIVYQYGMPCTDEDRKFADQGLLDSFTADTQSGNSCKVSSLDKLTRVLRAIATERPQPQGMFAIQRP